MSDPPASNPSSLKRPTPTDGGESAESSSFKDAFAEYERSHMRAAGDSGGCREGAVIRVWADSVLLDIGSKTEGLLPLTELRAGEVVKPGDKLLITVKGRDPEGYYQLVRGRVERPTDWASLEKAFADRATITGTVTSVVKGGLSVDVGVRAFMPASRSGARDAGEMEKLVGQEIRCRIIKLDAADEDVVVDRRAVFEDEERAVKDQRFSELREGDTVRGTVRTLTDYGAFIDIGGVDGLLHVGDLSWRRVNRPSDVLAPGQEIDARVLKVDADQHRISLGVKQLQPHPWDSVTQKYKNGDRVRGSVTRLTEFGAFVELEPGIEGLIHISEMSWGKKVRKPDDVVKPGETVDAVILGVHAGERRISLGLKQALGDPWAEAPQKFPAGAVIEGPVTSITKFGAFVQLAEGVEGMIHVSEISAEKRIHHPQDVLRVGQTVKALVLAVDADKKQLRLSMKQLAPTGLDEYLTERRTGDVVTGRIVEVSGAQARVELGEGVQGTCRIKESDTARDDAGREERHGPGSPAARADLSSLTSMLQARWKSGTNQASAKPEHIRTGMVRSFRIVKLDREGKTIEVELV
ncbi:MAG TPA: 30S ribosomal protein S1 [Terriglobales bacterium]|nr:30S ribosomal protein S1 [Terriglobales bacterium]